MRVVYILNVKSYSLEETNQVLKKLLSSSKYLLNYQVINSLTNKSNLSLLRAPQVNKKSQEQFKMALKSNKLIFEFFNLKNINFFEKLLKKIKLYSVYSNISVLVKKKVYFGYSNNLIF
jgi:ribosomal protein S10